ncbi:MAG: FHA domain-containing protein, partial [Planctomycetota bacterium]
MTQKLQIRLADGRGRPIKLGAEPLTIGRHPDNRLRIKDEKASRHHCVIEQLEEHDNQFMLRDLKSRNGTQVNGERVFARVMNAGDLIQIGAIVFRVELAAALGDRMANGSAAKGLGETERDLPWVKALWSVIENASISAAPKDESLDLLDARGNPSEALEGKGDGP